MNATGGREVTYSASISISPSTSPGTLPAHANLGPRPLHTSAHACQKQPLPASSQLPRSSQHSHCASRTAVLYTRARSSTFFLVLPVPVPTTSSRPSVILLYMCAHVPVDLLLELLLDLVDLLQYGTCIVQLYSCSMYTYSCTCMVPVGLVVVPILNKRKLADFDIICAVFLHFLDPQIGHSIAKISGYSPEPRTASGPCGAAATSGLLHRVRSRFES